MIDGPSSKCALRQFSLLCGSHFLSLLSLFFLTLQSARLVNAITYWNQGIEPRTLNPGELTTDQQIQWKQARCNRKITREVDIIIHRVNKHSSEGKNTASTSCNSVNFLSQIHKINLHQTAHHKPLTRELQQVTEI